MQRETAKPGRRPKGEDVNAVMATRLPSLMRRALAVPVRRKLMFMEALARASAAWVMIKLLPYRLWRRRLGILMSKPPPEEPLDAVRNRVVDDVAWAHHALQRLFGTSFTCLMLAVSARDMLATRGVKSHLFLGVERRTRPTNEDPLGAHAWVKAENRYVVGESRNSQFVIVAIYMRLT
jgi:hypothetical protein